MSRPCSSDSAQLDAGADRVEGADRLHERMAAHAFRQEGRARRRIAQALLAFAGVERVHPAAGERPHLVDRAAPGRDVEKRAGVVGREPLRGRQAARPRALRGDVRGHALQLGVRQRAGQVVEDRQRLGRGDADALVAAVVAAGAARDRAGRRAREQAVDQAGRAVHRAPRQRDRPRERRRAREQAVGGAGRRRRDLVLPGFCEQRRGQRDRLRAAHRIAMHRQVHPAAGSRATGFTGAPTASGDRRSRPA